MASDWRTNLGSNFETVTPERARRDELIEDARGCLAAARFNQDRFPDTATREAENAVRAAIEALAAHDGVRILSRNAHVAAIEYAELHPTAFDEATIEALDFLRVTRHASMYPDGDPQGPARVNVRCDIASASVDIAESVINRVVSLTTPTKRIPPPPRAGRGKATGGPDAASPQTTD